MTSRDDELHELDALLARVGDPVELERLLASLPTPEQVFAEIERDAARIDALLGNHAA